MVPIKGKAIKKSAKVEIPNLAEAMLGSVSLLNQINDVKDNLIEKVNQTIETAQNKVNDKLIQLERTAEMVEELKEEAIEIIAEIKVGPKGDDADEELIVERVVSRIPKIDTEKIICDAVSRVPILDEKKLKNDILSLVPRKSELKLIQEKIDIDPETVLEKIMSLSAEKRKKLSLNIENVSGLQQTISAMQNQLGRGYLHGGGISNINGLIQAGTNITLTGSGTSTSPYIINGSAASPLTTKGDLYTFSTINARLPVGTDGQVLVADSGAATGLSWINSSGITTTLRNVSDDSTTAPDSLYTMTSTIPVEFRRSGGSALLYLDETNGRVGIGDTTPSYALDVTGQGRFTSGILLDTTSNEYLTPGSISYNSVRGLILAGKAGSTFNFALYDPAANPVLTNPIGTTNIVFYGNVGIGTTSPDRKLHAEVSDAVTNAVTYAQRLSHITSGTATTSFGTGIEYELENASGTNRVAGTEEFTWSDATNATEDATYTLKLMNAGTLTTAFTAQSTVAGSTFGLGSNVTLTTNTGTSSFLSGIGNVTGTIAALNVYNFSAGADTSTSGTSNYFGITKSIAPGAGSANFHVTNLTYTINASGAQSGTATGIFLNATETALNSMTHNLMDLQVGGVSKFKVGSTGIATALNGYITAAGTSYAITGRGYYTYSADGVATLYDSALTSFNRLQFGGTTSSFPAIKRSTTGLQVRLADDSASTWQLASKLVEANTAGSGSPNIITEAESGTVFTNEGATALNYHTLPTAVAGLTYTFYVDDADGIHITANTSDIIQINGVASTAAGYAECTSIGGSITLVAINSVDWVCTASVGTWTLA